MISVIVPVYNVAAYLPKCLKSLDEQTEQDIEFIIVNDGSTDGSDKICEEFIKEKEKFRYFSKENGGLMSAWMEGVKHIRGDYVGFVDSDDYIDNTMFEKMYAIAKKYDVDIVMCDRYDVIGDEAKYLPAKMEAGVYLEDKIHIIHENILPKFGGWHITNARWNKIFRSELFIRNTKYCTHLSRICEDRFITPSCVFGAKSFYYLNEPLYYYVYRKGSNHSMPSVKLQDTMEMLYDIQKQMIEDYGLTKKYGELVERANLNYLRQMIVRNFAGEGDKKIRQQLAKRIFSNKEYARLVKKHKKDLTDRLGFAVKILFALKSPRLFVAICKKVGR